MVRKLHLILIVALLALVGQVSAQTAVFTETFDKCNGTGGNDGKWSSINGGSDISDTYTDNAGWNATKGYVASKCARFGTSKNQGSVTTPSISLTGNGTLTFKAGAWGGDATTLNISAEGATLDQSSVTLANSAFTDYTVNITSATGSVKITFTGKQASKARFFLDEVVVTSAASTGKTATTLTFAQGDKTYNVGDENGAAIYSNAATLSPAVDGATITYTSSDTAFATVDANGDVLVDTKAVGEATITASYAGNDEYEASTASYKITVIDPNAKGTVNNPYTVAEVLALTTLPSDAVHVKGIVSQIVTAYNSQYGNITFNISDDVATGNELQLYRCYAGPNETHFTSADDIQVGWTVTACGTLKDYTKDNVTTREMNQGCYVVSIEKPAVNVPTIEGVATFLDTTTVTINADEGATVYYTLEGSEPSENSTKYTAPFTLNVTTTVKAIAYKDGVASEVASKTFTKTTLKTVAEALNEADGTEVIVKGIVANVSTWNSQYPNINYFISDDGTTTTELEIFRGTGLNGDSITSQDDIARGDTVIVRGTLDTYKSTRELAEGSTLLSIVKPDETVTITDAGWATYVTKNDVSFPEGVTAYKVSYDATNDKITLNPVSAVPANNAIVLKANAGTYTLTKVESADSLSGNDLKYSWSDKTVETAKTIYVLAQNNGNVGFYPVAVNTTVPAFKGYLELSASSAKDFFSLDGEADGINNIEVTTDLKNAARYNLAGQRVDSNYKGIVIVNGKKVLIK